MEDCVTSKPWAFVNEDEKSRKNNKHLFRGRLQKLSTIPKTHKAPENISTSIVDAIHAIIMISVAGLKLRTLKSWADEIMNYLSWMPGNNLHVIFDYYCYEYSVPSKQRDVSQMARVVNSLNRVFLPQKNEMNF